MLNVEHACPYCGQFIAICIDGGWTEQEKDGQAKQKCGCPEAVRDRNIAEAMDKLRQIGGTDSLENGFDEPLSDEAMEVCRNAVGWIIDAKAMGVEVQCRSGDKMKITYAGSGRVKISRKCSKQMSL